MKGLPERVSIESLCTAVTSGGTPSRANPQYWEDGDVPWFKTGELNDWYLEDAEERITEDALLASSAKLFPPDTVLMAMYGDGKTITTLGILRREAATNQACCAMIVDTRRCDFLYLFYALKFHRHELLKLVVAGAQRNLSIGIIRSFKVLCHSRETQTRIADFLSPYDEMIQNNRRRMALLEEAARQIYYEWFVRLRFPGHEHTCIANGVPEGWEKRTFGEACFSLEDGDWIETKDQGGDDYRLLQISNIGVNEFVETENYRYVTEATFKRLNCRELLPGHILIARMPKPIGRAWLITEMPWRMITAVDAAIAVANEQLADAYFLTYYLNSPTTLEHCQRRAAGATRPRIARRELVSLPLLLPPKPLQAYFRQVAEPLNQQRTVLYKANEQLRAARDLLLPRLISGEILV